MKHWTFSCVGWLGMTGILSALLVGCIVESDDADGTPTSVPATATTTLLGTATAEGPSPTATRVPPSPTATQTATPSPTPTATPIPKVPIGELAPIDPSSLPNYTLTTIVELRGVPGQSDFVTSLTIEQSASDNYHLRSNTNDAELETWLVGGTSYLRQADGTVAQLPAGSDTALFSPAMLLQTLPPISAATLATPLDEVELGDRQVTHYQIDGDDFIDAATWLPPGSASDVGGRVELWVDDETRMILRQDADVTWENSDGTDGTFQTEYELTNIGTTPPIGPPQ